MAALLFSPHVFQSLVVLHRTLPASFSHCVRRAWVAIFRNVRPILAVVSNFILAVWVMLALASWSVILTGLLR